MACALLVEAVRPKPSWNQRMTTVPRPSRARLRTAWKATCGSSRAGLDRDVAAAPLWLEEIAREARDVGEGRRSSAREPEPVVEQARSEPDREREPARPEPDRLAGVVGRRQRLGLRGVPTGSPRVMQLGRRGPAVEEGDQRRAVGRGHVERRERQPILGRRRDAGLVDVAERDGRASRADPRSGCDTARARRRRRLGRRSADRADPGPRGRRELIADEPAHPAHDGDPGRGRGRPEEPPSTRRGWTAGGGWGGRDVGRVGHRQVPWTTVAATWDSGSASAATAAESALMSSWVSWS